MKATKIFEETVAAGQAPQTPPTSEPKAKSNTERSDENRETLAMQLSHSFAWAYSKLESNNSNTLK